MGDIIMKVRLVPTWGHKRPGPKGLQPSCHGFETRAIRV
jgi:hypothetical protein